MSHISPKMIQVAKTMVRNASTTPEEGVESTTKLTKKVLRLLFVSERISVRWGSGTASHWVKVVILLPINRKPKKWKDEIALINSVKRSSNALLEKSGIQFSQYYSDWGPGNRYCNCLSIEVRFAD